VEAHLVTPTLEDVFISLTDAERRPEPV
jgi:hypothetical protein